MNINILVGAVLFVSTSSCAQHHTHATEAPTQQTAASLTPLAPEANVQFNVVLSTYLELKTALAKDDGVTASEVAHKLVKAIDAVDTKILNSKQRILWTKSAKTLSYNADHISETTDNEHQREHFIPLSDDMYVVTKAFNANPNDIYYQFCPMANNGHGAHWLSADSKVTNPYFGKKMLNCGSTKETLSAAK